MGLLLKTLEAWLSTPKVLKRGTTLIHRRISSFLEELLSAIVNG
jgi:hypothetical protein